MIEFSFYVSRMYSEERRVIRIDSPHDPSSFTKDGLDVLLAASQFANARGGSQIEPIDLVYGLLTDDVIKASLSTSVDSSSLANALFAEFLTYKEEGDPDAELQFSSEAKFIIDLSVDIAKSMNFKGANAANIASALFMDRSAFNFVSRFRT